LWLHSLKVAQLLRSAACLHTNQSRSYLNHLVFPNATQQHYVAGTKVTNDQGFNSVCAAFISAVMPWKHV